MVLITCRILITFCVLNIVTVLNSVIVEKENWRAPPPHFKYTVDELLSRIFPKKVSNDIYLDPCKAGKLNI